MSDVSQGDGWWQASDGKWYPPETQTTLPPPPAPAPPPSPPAPAPPPPSPTASYYAAGMTPAAKRPNGCLMVLLGALVLVLAGCGVLLYTLERTDIGKDPFLERVAFYEEDPLVTGLAACDYAKELGPRGFLNELVAWERRMKGSPGLDDGVVDVTRTLILELMEEVCPSTIYDIGAVLAGRDG